MMRMSLGCNCIRPSFLPLVPFVVVFHSIPIPCCCYFRKQFPISSNPAVIWRVDFHFTSDFSSGDPLAWVDLGPPVINDWRSEQQRRRRAGLYWLSHQRSVESRDAWLGKVGRGDKVIELLRNHKWERKCWYLMIKQGVRTGLMTMKVPSHFILPSSPQQIGFKGAEEAINKSTGYADLWSLTRNRKLNWAFRPFRPLAIKCVNWEFGSSA